MEKLKQIELIKPHRHAGRDIVVPEPESEEGNG